MFASLSQQTHNRNHELLQAHTHQQLHLSAAAASNLAAPMPL
jgi:hypothetical protein